MSRAVSCASRNLLAEDLQRLRAGAPPGTPAEVLARAERQVRDFHAFAAVRGLAPYGRPLQRVLH
jgi:hypothetical protein